MSTGSPGRSGGDLVTRARADRSRTRPSSRLYWSSIGVAQAATPAGTTASGQTPSPQARTPSGPQEQARARARARPRRPPRRRRSRRTRRIPDRPASAATPPAMATQTPRTISISWCGLPRSRPRALARGSGGGGVPAPLLAGLERARSTLARHTTATAGGATADQRGPGPGAGSLTAGSAGQRHAGERVAAHPAGGPPPAFAAPASRVRTLDLAWPACPPAPACPDCRDAPGGRPRSAPRQ